MRVQQTITCKNTEAANALHAAIEAAIGPKEMSEIFGPVDHVDRSRAWAKNEDGVYFIVWNFHKSAIGKLALAAVRGVSGVTLDEDGNPRDNLERRGVKRSRVVR